MAMTNIQKMSDMMLLLLITFGLSGTGHAVQTSTGLFNTETLILGKKMEGYTLRTVLKVSVTQCRDECERRSDCGSFNYVRQFHMCELKPVSVTTANRVLTDAIGYVFGNKQVWFLFVPFNLLWYSSGLDYVFHFLCFQRLEMCVSLFNGIKRS